MRSSLSAPPDWLTARPYAHRGLHGPGRLENSRAAFEAAIAAGFGIELDVQVTAEGAAVVFHDYDLARLTGGQGRVDTLTLAALQGQRLNGLDETISSLPDILALIAGRTPLLVEIKNPAGAIGPLCRAVAAAVDTYHGAVAIMSFNPRIPRWFARHRPHLTRGLVVTERDKGDLRGRIARHLSRRLARPHFLAYDVRDLPSRFAATSRLPVLTWTVRSQDDEARAASHADQIIHEIPRYR